MGFFGSSTVTTIESTSVLLMDETPELVKDTITNAVLNNRGIADDIVANYLDSLHNKGKQLRKYAKDNYPYGLPDGTLNYSQAKDDLVRIVLKSILGVNVYIQVNYVDTASPLYFAYPHLVSNRGYNPSTGIVSNPPFSASSDVTVYNTQFLSGTQLRITYQYTTIVEEGEEEEVEQINYSTETISCSVVPHDVYYHVAYYQVNDKGDFISPLSFWFYNINDGTYPSLDIKSGVAEESQYYPIIPIRENSINLTDEDHQTTTLYKTSKRILNFWDVNIKTLGEAVHQSESIDDVDHAYVVVGVDIQDDNKYVLAYLYEYFTYLAGNSQYTKADFTYWEKEKSNTPPTNIITIKDARYKMQLAYYYSEITTESGSIGDVGTIIRSYDGGSSVSLSDDDFRSNITYETSTYTLKKQIGSNTIEVVTVKGLIHTNYVYENDAVTTTLRAAMDDSSDKNNFIIPINIDVADNLGLLQANSLMYYAIRVVFNTKVTQKLKWYETSFFKALVMVVAIILTAYGMYQLGQALVTAAAAGAVAVAQVIIQAVLISVAVNLAMEFLVNVVGLEGALVIVIAAVAASYMSDGASIGSIGAYQLPSAIDFMQVASAFATAYQNEVQDALEDIQSELTAFQEYAEGLMEDIIKENEKTFGIDAYSLQIVDTSMGNYETAEEFIYRTTYTDNIGTLALEMPAIFVDRLLKLDTPTNEIRTQLT